MDIQTPRLSEIVPTAAAKYSLSVYDQGLHLRYAARNQGDVDK